MLFKSSSFNQERGRKPPTNNWDDRSIGCVWPLLKKILTWPFWIYTKTVGSIFLNIQLQSYSIVLLISLYVCYLANLEKENLQI